VPDCATGVRGLVRGDTKLVQGRDASYALFDLAADPGEQHAVDAAAWGPEADCGTERWAAELETVAGGVARAGSTNGWIAVFPADSAGVSDEMRERLAALGYAR